MNVRALLLIISVVVVGLFLLFGRTARGITTLRGSTNIVSEERMVSDFQAIDFAGIGQLTIVQGEHESLTIEADDNMLPYITSQVSNGTLKIAVTNGMWQPILLPTQPIHYRLQVKSLTRLDVSGAGVVNAATLHAEELFLNQGGVDTITIDNLTSDRLTVQMSGAGTVQVAGHVTTQSVEISGLGTYQAGELESQRAQVTLSGAGSATVWVQTDLDANLSGAGTVNYYGTPRLSTSTTGLVNLNSLGMK